MQNHGYADILQIYPKKWGNLTREGGYEVIGENMNDFIFSGAAMEAIIAFQPDVVYLQNELYCKVSKQIQFLVKNFHLKAKLVFFIWENAKASAALYNDGRVREVIQSADGIICGNSLALEYVKPFMLSGTPTDIMPQVGVDTSLFQPSINGKKYDYIFVGRESGKKGWGVIEKAIDQKKHPLLKLQGVEYEKMYKSYQQARVHLSPVLDETYWCEQWLSYSHAEALSCGLYCVGSDTASVVEYGKRISGMHFAKRGDVNDLKEKAELALDEFHQKGTNWPGREYVRNNLGFVPIANKTLRLWEAVLKK